MKAIFISFNQAYYDAIIAIMDRNGIKGYTYWEEVQGRGSRTGKPHFGSHAWPTKNSAILVVVEKEKVELFLDLLHKLDIQTEAQGLRAFAWNIEQSI
jgi:nitrogen regulatory protein PII